MPSFGPFLQVEDIVQFTTYCRQNEQLGINVFHYRVSNVPAPNVFTLGHLMDWISNVGIDTQLTAMISSSARFEGFGAQVIFPVKSIAYFDNTGAGPGARAFDALPRQAAGFFRKRADVPGRRKSGRVYIPFPCEDDNLPDGTPSGDYRGLVTGLAIKMVSQPVVTLAGQDYRAVPIIYHRAAPVNSPTWSNYFVPAKWASQRRRGSFGRADTLPF